MEYFEKLADRVEEIARVKCLPDAAHDALEELPPSEEVTIDELIAWVASSQVLPKQVDLPADFGDHALTAAHREGFHIQLLYWKDACTAIHDHGFSGAFTVISGSSINVQYEFDVDDDDTPHFVTGRLRHRSTELLRSGEVRRIASGPSFIHGVFHLDRPTLSLVIRSFSDELARPALGYRPTLGFDHARKNPETTRKLQHLGFVFDCYPSTAKQVLREMLVTADPAQSYVLLESTLSRGETIVSLDPLLRLVEERHGRLASGFAEALAFVRRTNNIVGRREIVNSKEHRLLLALLLTAPNRSALLQLVAALTNEDPAATICRWLTEMSTLSVDPVWGPNAVGLALTQSGMKFLAAALDGADADTAAASASDDPREQVQLALTLPRCTILKPIFAE